ncbi:MAG TPA: 2-amino-4-hydroxy-6-hydroxymethyldihydropteridine diphosphokinase [Nocardioidaceae bacterium]|nr:2-amino-4-hydroxy-6-hydroxymethyldihydropteridine diphosphokinase [Nocardioidaceae bacterium]
MTPTPSSRGVDADGPAAVAVSRRAVVALGSNLGDRQAALQGALDRLADTPGVRLVAASPVYESAPVGGPVGAGDYLNAVVVIDTTLRPTQLLEQLHAIESCFGRVRRTRNDPRTLDLDLVVLGSHLQRSAELTLPHPRAGERPFVLRPWLDVDPSAELPGSGSVADLLARADTDGLRRRTDLSLELR